MKTKNTSTGNKRGRKKPGFPSKRELYQKLSGKADELIDRLFDLTKSPNHSVAVSACKTLIDRVLPTLKAYEFTDENERHLGVVILPPQYSDETSINKIGPTSRGGFTPEERGDRPTRSNN